MKDSARQDYNKSMDSAKLSKWQIISTAVMSFLVTLASLAGLFSSSPYVKETENWVLQAQGQDIGNLVAVVVLLLSAYKATKGSSKAFFVWLGMLFYLLYAYIIYAVAVHFNSLFLVYVAVLGLTFYTIVTAVSLKSVQAKLPKVNKFASYTLIIIGILFTLLWLSEIIPALATGKTPQGTIDAGLSVNPIHVLDLAIVLPGFIATGYLSLKGRKIGTYLLAPWLTFSALMGSSIVASMMLMMVNDFSSKLLPAVIIVSVVVIGSISALVSFMRAVHFE